MTGIWAKTVLRSRHAAAPEHVLSTLLVRLPTVLLAEFNTHRAFSRNAASTRAIPTERLIQQVQTDPFVPSHWGANQSGMQAVAECNHLVRVGWDGENLVGIDREQAWLRARDSAVSFAQAFADVGYHKQIAGRLLAPFMWTIVCVSATEWANFLELRDHPAAEPHMQILAKAVRAELDRTDNIQALQPGEWHLPFATGEGVDEEIGLWKRVALSVARCASTSYKTVEGFDMSLDRASELHDKLVGSRPIHASPTEHAAEVDEVVLATDGDYMAGWKNPSDHRNFVGFRQYRAMVDRHP